MDYNRHVCLKDLDNYLNKAEYLDGYTPTEQKQVRKNIGAIGEANLASYITETKFIPLTHAELVDLIKDNKLGTGSFNNLKFINNNYTSIDINKQISKVDEGYALSYLDPDTLTLQVHRL